jgi:hypothetical protein
MVLNITEGVLVSVSLRRRVNDSRTNVRSAYWLGANAHSDIRHTPLTELAGQNDRVDTRQRDLEWRRK